MILSNCILPTHSSRKCFNTHQLYTVNTHFYNSSINVGSISFFLSSHMDQSHHPLGRHATGINSSLNSFLSSLRFSNLICLIVGKIKTILIMFHRFHFKFVLNLENMLIFLSLTLLPITEL